jgi:hypothetical protein
MRRSGFLWAKKGGKKKGSDPFEILEEAGLSCKKTGLTPFWLVEFQAKKNPPQRIFLRGLELKPRSSRRCPS